MLSAWTAPQHDALILIASWHAFLQEFILNTPNNEASKFWIGGVAQTARISAIFAQVR